MKFLVVFTLTDYQRSSRTALVLADSKGQAHRVLIQNMSTEELEILGSIEYRASHTISTMLNISSPTVLGVLS
ncbi:hypothetical protein LCGC14_1590660 [marine sediment metagenome]|uniref:Uncharacterized protein n=1 Tax=marine sediment metagenome TaxID=412755 RepID=A0A0F9IEE2_9ZZZZ